MLKHGKAPTMSLKNKQLVTRQCENTRYLAVCDTWNQILTVLITTQVSLIHNYNMLNKFVGKHH